MSRFSSRIRAFLRSWEETAGDALSAFLDKAGPPGFVLVAQFVAPVLVLDDYWGKRYAPSDVEVLEGATFDERSPTWHAIVFTARIGSTETHQEILLHRVNRTIESSRGQPPLFQLPHEYRGSGTLGLMMLGILPVAFTSIAGLPIYAVRRLYFKALEETARVHGMDAAKYALAKALAPHLTEGVHELLLEALRNRQKSDDGELTVITGGTEALAKLLRTAHRVEAPRLTPSDHPDYQWYRDHRLIATAIWNPDGKENASPTDYLFEPTREVFEWDPPQTRPTPEEVEILLKCFSSTKPLST